MSKQQRSLRDKERELGEGASAGGATGGMLTASASAESECDRDKEVMQRCLKLLMMGRTAPQSPAPKVRNIFLAIILRFFIGHQPT